MKAERLKSMAEQVVGGSALDRYNNLCEQLDYSSKRGVSALFSECLEQGGSDEEAAAYVFNAIRRL